MNKRNFHLLFCLTLSLLLPSATVFAEDLVLAVGAAPYANIFSKIAEPYEAQTGIHLSIRKAGTFDSLQALDQGEVEAAIGAMLFKDWMNMMGERGYAVADPGRYAHRVIGRDIIKVACHPGVGVEQLSSDQLRDIFSGSVTSWSQVGGPDLPITLVFAPKLTGTNRVFRKAVMEGRQYRDEFVRAETGGETRELIATTAGAVGLIAEDAVDASVVAPAIPTIGRPITVVTIGKPSPGLERLIEYIRGDGSRYLAQ